MSTPSRPASTLPPTDSAPADPLRSQGGRARTTINRVLLVLVGVLLVGGGGYGLARGWGAFGTAREHGVLVRDSLRRRLLTSEWWWPTLYAVLSALMVLALVVLLVQFRRSRLSVARVDGTEDVWERYSSGHNGSGSRGSGHWDRALDAAERWPDGGHTTVLGRAVADAVADEAEKLPGVTRAGARLTGTSRAPALSLSLVLTPDTEVDQLLDALEAGPLVNVAAGLGVESVPAVIRLACGRSTTHRTR